MARLGFMKGTTELSDTFVKQISNKLSSSWVTVKKSDLEAADGRKKDAPPYATAGSFLYIAYKNDVVLYVGETSVSVRSRFIGDGSGAHNTKDWYQEMTHVNYIKATDSELPDKYRKLLEQALSIAFSPKYYGKSN